MRVALTISACLLFGSPFLLYAQETVAQRIFFDTRIVNGHSVETEKPGTLQFIIAHRFGKLNSGIQNLFGLDESTIRLGLDYGLTPWFTLGIGRSSFQKTFDFYGKLSLIRQHTSFPISATLLQTIALNSLRQTPGLDLTFDHRLSYTSQLLLARKFGRRLSIQLMPTYIHRNLVSTSEEKNDVFSLGVAGRIQVNRRLALLGEYFHTPTGQLDENFFSPQSLSLGAEIHTGGHVFQMHLSNSRGMIERLFITESEGKWKNGDIYFGFNVSRDFNLRRQ